MTSKNYHVTSRPDGKWQVIKDGGARASAITDTQKAAIDRGRDLSRNNASELLIHGRDGKIRDKNSYGNDPYPPRG